MASMKVIGDFNRNLLQIHLIFKRNVYVKLQKYGNKDWKGYYERKMIPWVYEQRKKEYRQKVLGAYEELPTIEQKLKELRKKDPVLDQVIDIGLPGSLYKKNVSIRERLDWQKKIRSDIEFEKRALANSLTIDLDSFRKEWQNSAGPTQIATIAEHYGIYRHLYQHAMFIPWIPMNISYDYEQDSVTPVFMGNILDSIEAEKIPRVHFDAKPDDLWTLIMTNLDGHLLDENSEYLHWFVGNIKGNDLASGEVICDYLRPFPFRGTGYHRLVFVLYKQNEAIDYKSLQKKPPCLSLKERTFKTFDFYKVFQDKLTPAGLAFFQCVWDPSLTHFFHHVLNMREPNFHYNENIRSPKPQVHYPQAMPFNVYLDRYRDPKEIAKEVFLKRMKLVHPFKEEEPMAKFPMLHRPTKLPPSWLMEDMRNERLRIGKYRDLRPHSVYPQEDNQGNYSTRS